MDMRKIAIVDDNDLDIKELNSVLTTYFNNANITVNIDLYRNPENFLNRFNSQFDLVFLDIEMPGISGIDLAKKVREKDDKVKLIFTTHHPKYAIDGYGVNALSFFVKPITLEALSLRMNHLLPLLKKESGKKITFKIRDNVKIFYSDKIKYIDVNGHYVTVHSINDKDFEVRASLGSLEKELESEKFARCNNYCLVNLDYVKSVENGFVIIDGGKIEISRNRKKAFMETLNGFFDKQ